WLPLGNAICSPAAPQRNQTTTECVLMLRTETKRRLPIGAEVQPGGGVHFRVWAPKRRKVGVALEERVGSRPDPARAVLLGAEGGGYFSGLVAAAAAGMRYRL